MPLQQINGLLSLSGVTQVILIFIVLYLKPEHSVALGVGHARLCCWSNHSGLMQSRQYRSELTAWKDVTNGHWIY